MGRPGPVGQRVRTVLLNIADLGLINDMVSVISTSVVSVSNILGSSWDLEW